MHVDTPQTVCRFGLARCDITPPSDIYHRMWGAASHDRATGVHRPLTATAMVLCAGDDQADQATRAPNDDLLVVVALDHCLLWAAEMNALVAAIAAGSGLPAETIAVVFSHTHAAGLMGRERAEMPGGALIEPYLAQLGVRLGKLVAAAHAGLQPAVLSYAYGHSTMAAERDLWDEASGQFVCGFNPEGVCDDRVLVARVTDAGGKQLASVVNYACHPTTLAWDNTLVSPDFPGAMRQVVEQATGVPCVFIQGASGDVGPRDGFTGDLEVADRNGRQLGYAALEALESLPPPLTRFVYQGPVVSGATIGTWRNEPLSDGELAPYKTWRLRRLNVDLPYREGLAKLDEVLADRERWQTEEQAARAAGDEARAADCRAMVERSTRHSGRLAVLPAGPTFPFPLTVAQLGGAGWVFFESEAYNQLQRTLRDELAPMPLLVASLTNGSRVSYLPPRDRYGKGIYQETIATLAPGSLETLTDAIRDQLADFGKSD